MDSPEHRKERLDALLLMIGGYEAAILNALEQKDWQLLDTLKPLQAKYYERLRRVAYGLPEEKPVPPEDKS